MTDKSDKAGLSRRQMLALAPFAGAHAVLPSSATAQKSSVPLRADPREVRFQDNDHIRTFYRLARN
ncbi:hypothetical protein ACSQ76_02445 [Roseovarius sp. B08]|uniref:hypothetical protein n=1 Tax=Roseovarius sp. B08 TaxID=3449223 RepID=UPI003EDC43CC